MVGSGFPMRGEEGKGPRHSCLRLQGERSPVGERARVGWEGCPLKLQRRWGASWFLTGLLRVCCSPGLDPCSVQGSAFQTCRPHCKQPRRPAAYDGLGPAPRRGCHGCNCHAAACLNGLCLQLGHASVTTLFLSSGTCACRRPRRETREARVVHGFNVPGVASKINHHV
jgi:hypothetical protein